MKDKKSFLLYCDLIHTIEKLPNDQAGKLFKIILEYVNDLNPEVDDLLLSISFEPIKQQLKRDLEKWSGEKKDRSNNGRLGNLKRWNEDLYDQVIDNQITIDEAESIATDRKASPPDPTRSPTIANVAVSDSVTVSVNDKVKNNINSIYSLYPTKCPVRNANTGKGSKNKDQIKKLLKKHSVENLKAIIENYVNDCVGNGVYLKNFTTLLNNLPDEIVEPVKKVTLKDLPDNSYLFQS